jgi:hypothetical protein
MPATSSFNVGRDFQPYQYHLLNLRTHVFHSRRRYENPTSSMMMMLEGALPRPLLPFVRRARPGSDHKRRGLLPLLMLCMRQVKRWSANPLATTICAMLA